MLFRMLQKKAERDYFKNKNVHYQMLMDQVYMHAVHQLIYHRQM